MSDERATLSYDEWWAQVKPLPADHPMFKRPHGIFTIQRKPSSASSESEKGETEPKETPEKSD